MVQVLPLPQCEFLVHRHCPDAHVPRVQSLLLTHAAGWHEPLIAPAQVAAPSEQSEEVPQPSVWHVPTMGGEHTEVTPQSVSPLHAPPPLTSASAETWKSLNTTRPHWLAAAAVTGVL